MIDLKLYVGKIINFDDPDKKGRTQIKVIPELQEVGNDDCPWVMPLFGQQIHNLKVDDIVWVLGSEYFQENEMFFFPKYFINDLINYDDITNILSSVTDKGTNTYQHMRFTLYPDNSLIYFNADTGEKAVVQSDGSYILIDTNGNIYVKPHAKFKLYNDSTTLKAILKDLQEVVKNMLTPLQWIDSATGAPVTYLGASSDLTKISTTLTNINALLKD